MTTPRKRRISDKEFVAKALATHEHRLGIVESWCRMEWYTKKSYMGLAGAAIRACALNRASRKRGSG